MSIPGQTFRILDPGLGLVPPAPNAPMFLGCCSAGTVNQLYSLSRISDVVEKLGEGPLAEAVAQTLGTPNAGGPVLAMVLAQAIAGAWVASSLTKVGTGAGTVTGGGTPKDAYSVKVTITKSGALGAAEFTYSLDGGLTTSPTLVVPSGGVFNVPTATDQTGITLTFASTFVAGDVYSGSCTAPFYNASGIDDGVNAAIAQGADFAFMVYTGEAATCETPPSSGAAIATKAGSVTDTLFNRYQFVRAIVGAGGGNESEAIAAYASFAHSRVLVTYGQCVLGSKKPFTGWGYPTRSIVDVVAARATAALISTDLGRVASGALPNILSITHDEAITETLDQKRFTTLRTLQGRPGFYITQGRFMSAPGSDYKYWQLGRCMDVACATAAAMQLNILNDDVRTNADGTLDEGDAVRYETPIEEALKVVLIDPNAANGTPGHVSETGYHIDRTNNVQTSDTLKTSVAIRPRGYIKQIVTELGYTLNVGG